MITRLRIKNYRSIADLDLELGRVNLLMGGNGTGKTSVFDALAALRDLVVEGEKCEKAFPIGTIPRWDFIESREAPQEMRVDLETEVSYYLEVRRMQDLREPMVSAEAILLNEQVIHHFTNGRVELNQDPSSAYSFLPLRSPVATFPAVPELENQVALRDAVAQLWCLRIEPSLMSASSLVGSARPHRNLSDFSAWHRLLSVREPDKNAQFQESVAAVLPGFRSLEHIDVGGGAMMLRAMFHDDRRDYPVSFDELSDGQRALIVLYAIVHFAMKPGAVVCLDEPDNYLTLSEIQPWLLAALDKSDETGCQLLIASHHPELFNYLAPDHGIVFERDGAGPTTARRFNNDPESLLTPAERVARGWEAP